MKGKDSGIKNDSKLVKSTVAQSAGTYAGEEQGTEGGVHNVENFVLNEDAEDGGDEQDNQTDEKHTPAGSEVIFALLLKQE